MLFISNDSALTAFFPGFAGAFASLFGIVSLTLWPVHKSLVREKRTQLDAVDAQIRAVNAQDIDNPETVSTLAPLLTYRRELRQAPEWPVDIGVIARLALYAIIPPLTWVGAALIENVVDMVLT